MFPGFANPLLLAGAALIAIPILIHLLNKRRFRTVEWAAMEFLLQAEHKNRRRIQVENVLLLILRCLLVALIVAAVARPQVRKGSLLSIAAGATPTDRVVVWDDSLSTGHVSGSGTCLDAMRDDLLRILPHFETDWRSDALTLVRTSKPTVPDYFRFAPRGAHRRDAEARIRQAAPTARSANLVACLESVRERVSGGAQVPKALYLLSDFRATDFAAAGAGSGLEIVLDKLAKEGWGITFLDRGADDVENTGIVALEPEEKLLVANAPVRFSARVRNFGDQPVGPIEISFKTSEGVVPAAAIPSIPARGEAFRSATLLFSSPGSAWVEATASADRLAGDNARAVAFTVTSGLPVLLVNGEPKAEAFGDETAFLAFSLAPPGAVVSGFKPQVVLDRALHPGSFEGFPVVILANVERLPEDVLAALERHVSEGAGLVVFPGTRTDVDSYRAEWFKAGKGLLPVPPIEARSAPREAPARLSPDGIDPRGVLRVFEGSDNPSVRTLQIGRWLALEEPAKDAGVEILARLQTPAREPFLARKAFGKGRVWFFSISADRDGSNWPTLPSYLATLFPLVEDAGSRAEASRNLAPGAPLVVTYPAAKCERRIQIRPPGKNALVEIDGAAVEGTALYRAEFADTENPGVYTVVLKEHERGETFQHFTVNPEPDEGDLRRIPHSELERRLPAVKGIQWVRDVDDLFRASAPEASEIWRTLMHLFLLLLAIEALLAWRFGRGA
ncbi:MAG: BatA domain-containing protein [Planctomycetota bacterium]|mgnify:CR=1 FL=1